MYDEDAAALYDSIYITAQRKDYAVEADSLVELIRERSPDAGSLLDVACGTGEHLRHLRQHFRHVEGLELSAPMRERAETKLPGVRIHAGDLRDFALDARFDAVTCLFSAVGYLGGVGELRRAVATMAAHVNDGGVLIVEPWFTPEQWHPGRLGYTTTEADGRTVIRMSHSTLAGRTSVMKMHYLVGDPDAGVRHFEEEHVMTLFTEAEYRAALSAAGCTDLAVIPSWSDGRGRIVGTVRPDQRP